MHRGREVGLKVDPKVSRIEFSILHTSAYIE
jgi:hypothetical protein